MSAAAAAARPSPTSSWENKSPSAVSPSQRQQIVTTPTLLGDQGSQSVPAYDPSTSGSSVRRPRVQHGPHTTGPSYFGLVVDHSNEAFDTAENDKKWSPSLSVKSRIVESPVKVLVNERPNLEPFRNHSQWSLPPLKKKRSEDRRSSSPRSRDGSRDGSRDSRRESSRSKSRTELRPTAPDPMNLDEKPNPRAGSQESVPSQVSFFDQPSRTESPANISWAQHLQQPSFPSTFNSDDRHARSSLPGQKNPPPAPWSSPLHKSSPRSNTLPASLSQKDPPTLINAEELLNLIGSSLDNFLLLDLRVYPQYSRSRISGALNLCIPTTLLKRPTFDLQKLAGTFTKPEDKERFSKWKECTHIVVYDERSSSLQDATSCIHTLNKFTEGGWKGNACILKSGFVNFSDDFSHMVDNEPVGSLSPSTKSPLSIDPAGSQVAPVAGGCPLPVAKTAANPFFSNIRQNMDLIGGVGQMDISRPSTLTQRGEAELPRWIKNAANPEDHGKVVSERFLQIEKDEQQRMQDAMSCQFSYGTPNSQKSPRFQIAGVEKGRKNRYNNIWPYEHARVRLQNDMGSTCDYVNASYVKAKRSRKRYIATQAPMPDTFNDFWQLVWEQDVRLIVMLTAEKEEGQRKADPYWTGKDFGPLKLRQLSEKKVALEMANKKSPQRPQRPGLGQRRSTNPVPKTSSTSTAAPYLIVRKFTLLHTSHPFMRLREITQIAYSSWPDFGSPAHPTQVLKLVEQCNAASRSSSYSEKSDASSPESIAERPIVVHCSAGCGRTGAFCTIDSVLDVLKQQQSDRQQGHNHNQDDVSMDVDQVDDETDLISSTVDEFRHQRLSMVQNLRQFVLCYETVLEWLVEQQPDELKITRSSSSSATPTLKGVGRRSFHG